MLNWFKKQKPESQPEPEEFTPLVSIEFFVNESGNLDQRVFVIDKNQEVAKLLGYMFYLITSGRVNQNVISYFDEIVNEDVNNQVFIKQVIDEWSKRLIKDKKEEELPVVGPMEFLSNIKRDLGED